MKSKNKQRRFIVFTVLSSILILGAGIAGMTVLANMKTAPAKKPSLEAPLRVKVMKTQVDSVTPYIGGYGEVKAVDVITISAETEGKVIMIHPRLEVGELISKNDVLIKIDTRNEHLALKSNLKRRSALKRNLKLTKNEYQRLYKLNKKNNLVTISEVEKAEQVYQSTIDAFSQLEHAISNSQLQIDKSTITAPFNGRIKGVAVEKGQYLTPGTNIVTLVDDSLLEIVASIDSEKAERILNFNEKDKPAHRFWFSKLEQVPVRVRWTQASSNSEIWGLLHRVVAFDSKNRMLKIAVRLNSDQITDAKGFPIVEGMFCQVQIPGKELQNIVKLPRYAVQYDHTVRVVAKNRLKTVPVNVAWVDEEFSYISAGLNDVEHVIITRLSNPLENTRVEFESIDMVATAGNRRSP